MRHLQTCWLSLLLPGLLLSRVTAFGAGAGEGKDWIPLLEWAHGNGFKEEFVEEGKAMVLTNNFFRLSFRSNSQMAEINGVNVWLCDRIEPKSGQDCISALDLEDTIRPILFPKANLVRAKIRTIYLDPGHGGKDTGGIFSSHMEKRYTLPLAEELAKQLETAGFKVVLTRTNDTFVELEDRPALADRNNADLFISLHFNIGPPGRAKGVEVYCLTPPNASSTNEGRPGEFSAWTDSPGVLPGNRCDDWNILLAYQLEKSLVKNLSEEDRGVRRARFAVLRTADMPAVLIEGGFLSDPLEREKIGDPRYRDHLAAAIVRGVLAYQQAVKS